MHPKADINVDEIPKLMAEEQGRLKFYNGSEPKFVYTDRHDGYRSTKDMMDKAREIVRRLSKA